MKASEIFLEFAAPSRSGLPEDVTVDQLKKALMIPELVWNAIVMDKDPTRKQGQLPKLLISTINKDFPLAMRKNGELMMTFWVNRKDLHFSEHRWPMVTEIYENLKKELIVRVKVHGPEQLREHLPKEWNEKQDAKVLPIEKSTN